MSGCAVKSPSDRFGYDLGNETCFHGRGDRVDVGPCVKSVLPLTQHGVFAFAFRLLSLDKCNQAHLCCRQLL